MNVTVAGWEGRTCNNEAGLDLTSMTAVILAGGRGSRLGQESERMPKALVPIGDRPILHHILETILAHGIRRVIIALGHLGPEIVAYFRDCSTNRRSWQSDAETGSITAEYEDATLPTVVELVDTGVDTGSGDRIRRLAPRLAQQSFLMTYCDGLSDLDLRSLVSFHRGHKRLATVAAVHPRSPYGHLDLAGDVVTAFEEKPVLSGSWVNGGVFVLNPSVFSYIEGDNSSWEQDVMVRLAQAGQLAAYRHEGFWQCMDTQADRERLSALCRHGRVPWQFARGSR